MTKTNFTSWNAQELRDWVENISLCSLLNINNINTYIQILKELINRKGDIYDNRFNWKKVKQD